MRRRRLKSRFLNLNNKNVIILALIFMTVGIATVKMGFLSIYAGGWEFNSTIDRVYIKATDFVAQNETDLVYSDTFGTSSVVWDPDGRLRYVYNEFYGAIPTIRIYESNFFSMDLGYNIQSETLPFRTKVVNFNGYNLSYSYYHLGYDLMIRTDADWVDGAGPATGYYEGAEFDISLGIKLAFNGHDYRVLGSNETGWAGILSVSVLSSELNFVNSSADTRISAKYEVRGFPPSGSLLNMMTINGSYIKPSDNFTGILNIPSTVYYNISGTMRAGAYVNIGQPTIVYNVYANLRILVDVITISNYVPDLSASTGLKQPTDFVHWANPYWLNLLSLFDGSHPELSIATIIFILVALYILYLILKNVFGFGKEKVVYVNRVVPNYVNAL